jgi:hypothetical protein
LDRGLLDGRYRAFKFVEVGCADRDETGRTQDAVARGQVGLLL